MIRRELENGFRIGALYSGGRPARDPGRERQQGHPRHAGKKISVGGALKRLSKHGSKRHPFPSFASQAIDF